MITLGIDPGFATVGYGVVKYEGNRFTTLDYGTVVTSPHTPFPERLEQIYEGVRELILKYNPDAMAVEELFFNSNTKTAVGVCHGRGVILLAAAKSSVPVFEYTPLQVKQAVVGYGRAEKQQVIRMTEILLNLQKAPKPDDVADALAVAVCHAHSKGSKLF